MIVYIIAITCRVLHKKHNKRRKPRLDFTQRTHLKNVTATSKNIAQWPTHTKVKDTEIVCRNVSHGVNRQLVRQVQNMDYQKYTKAVMTMQNT